MTDLTKFLLTQTPTCEICTDTGQLPPIPRTSLWITDELGVSTWRAGFCSCEEGEKLRTTYEAERVLAVERLEDEKEARKVLYLKESRLPLEYAGYPLSTWPIEDNPLRKRAFDLASRLARGDPAVPGLYIYGPVGTGKTGLAAGVLLEYIAQGKKGFFISGADIISGLLYRFSKKDGSATLFTGKLSTTPLLILDDLLVPKSSTELAPWIRDILFGIIEHRKTNFLPLIITSNVKMEEIEIIYDKRVQNRIQAMCVPIPIGGESRRTIARG